jgi:translocation and assembly module TamB
MPEAEQNSVQDLDAAEGIRIGAHRADGKFVAIPLQPLDEGSADEDAEQEPPTRVRVHLGNAVWVERGRQAKVQLTGDLQVESGVEQQVSGRIELRGGKLDVSGKQFEIERGVITFEGDDPGNPTITATARWDSPAEYTVYADYAGTVKNGKLKLRAEPSLTQDEILSLILFGSPTGNVGSGQGGGNAGAAVGVAGGTATKGLNRAISDVTSLDVSTRIDTSTGSARPELVVQLTPRLTTRVTRALGEPAVGESPDRTFLTLELRLKRSWAVSAVIGDHGASALDLIWRKRY